MEESVRYSLNQKEQLTAFLEVTKVPIRNNLASAKIVTPAPSARDLSTTFTH